MLNTSRKEPSKEEIDDLINFLCDKVMNEYNIGALLHLRRIQMHHTLQEIADATGTIKATVMRWENDSIKNMGRDKIASLTAILQISAEEVIDTLGPEENYPEVEAQNSSKGYSMSPQQEVLFSASADLTPEEMDAVLKMIEELKSTRRD